MKADFTNDDINHYKDESISLFYKKFSELKNIDPDKNLRKFSIKLGELFHYIADFFCYAHNSEKMKENYLFHFKYEWQLNKFAYNSNKKIFEVNTTKTYMHNLSIAQIIESEHKKYLNLKQSFKTDLLYSFRTSILLTEKFITETAVEKSSSNSYSPVYIAK